VRLSVLANGPLITGADVEELAFGVRPAGAGAGPGPLPSLQLRELERLAIAEALGVALKTLHNKLNAAPDATPEVGDEAGDDEEPPAPAPPA
jgi:hypothetical protein